MMMLDFNLLRLQLNIDAARWTTEFHEAIRRVIEEHIGPDWRVVKIKEDSATEYQPVQHSLAEFHPEHILAEATSSFEIELVEQPLSMLRHMYLTAKLISNGKLMITQVRR